MAKECGPEMKQTKMMDAKLGGMKGKKSGKKESRKELNKKKE